MTDEFELFRHYFKWASSNIEKAWEGGYPSEIKEALLSKIGKRIDPEHVKEWFLKKSICTDAEKIDIEQIYRIHIIRKKHEQTKK